MTEIGISINIQNYYTYHRGKVAWEHPDDFAEFSDPFTARGGNEKRLKMKGFGFQKHEFSYFLAKLPNRPFRYIILRFRC